MDDRTSCGIMRARLLVLAYLDDHTGTSHHLGWDLGRGGSGDDPTIINAYTVDGRVRGYESITHESGLTSSTPMPLTPFDNGVYVDLRGCTHQWVGLSPPKQVGDKH